MTALLIVAMVLAAIPAQASSVEFSPRELFRVSLGQSANALGARVVNNNFLIPRDFTMDTDGHFYIYDSNKHRIVRFSSAGTYEMSIEYPASVSQVFAHADTLQNLWLLISDPLRGLYFGVYDTKGKRLREGLFKQFSQYRLHVDDDGLLHVIVSSDRKPDEVQTYYLDQESLLLKKENIARPPEEHHKVRKSEHTFYIDPLPGSSPSGQESVMQITDERRRSVASIKGKVIYVTDFGEVYTRVGDCDLAIYDIDGSLRGKVHLEGLPASCAAIRFDSGGNIYELDGVPDEAHRYTPAMSAMRLIIWERSH